MAEEASASRLGLPEPSASPGARRAAAVLLGLGPEVSRSILEHLDEMDVRALARGARALREESPQLMGKALREFVDAMGGFGTDLLAGDGLLKDLVASALGVEAAERAFREEQVVLDAIIEPLLDADLDDLGLVLSRERPQVIAPLVGAFDEDRAAKLLARLPSEKRGEVLRRLAVLKTVSEDVLADIVSAVVEQLALLKKGARRRLAGDESAVAILRKMPPAQQSLTLEEIAANDPDLAAELKSRLVTFEDVARLDDRDVQTLLKQVEVPRLTIALKGATEAAKQKILNNLSSRVATMLLDDLEVLGAVRLADIEEAHKEIAKVMLTLSEEGTINLPLGEEESA
ncbi:MAG: flagellar motor switch protein FliG [Myxococcota bacterium]